MYIHDELFVVILYFKGSILTYIYILLPMNQILFSKELIYHNIIMENLILLLTFLFVILFNI